MSIQPNALFVADALALLERMDPATVTLAYLDPPEEEFEFSCDSLPWVKLPASRWRGYLEYMIQVVYQLHRVLTSSGSLLCHLHPLVVCRFQPLVSGVFGSDQLRNVIISKRDRPARIGRVGTNRVTGERKDILVEPDHVQDHETILVYTKSDTYVYNAQYRPYREDDVQHTTYSRKDSKGSYKLAPLSQRYQSERRRFAWKGVWPPEGQAWRFPLRTLEQFDKEGRIHHEDAGKPPRLKVYLSDSPGYELASLWDDLPCRVSARFGGSWWPSRPLPLLERIIRMGSDPGDVILDPFCRVGSCLVAAHANERRWIGCDIDRDNIADAVKGLSKWFGIRHTEEYLLANEEDLKRNHRIVASNPHLSVPRLPEPPERATPIYQLHEPLPMEETRHYEFKEPQGPKPVQSIKNQVDKYVVAFLNSDGGRIFWGVRDSDRWVVGVPLDYSARDELRREVANKLLNILPPIDPTAYRVELHQVYDGSVPAGDLHLLELVVPRPSRGEVFYTGGNELYVRLDGVNKKLRGTEVTDYILRWQASAHDADRADGEQG